MALVNVARREVLCKIVYYGAGYCGKTTNLQVIHTRVPAQERGELLAVTTEQERTLFFDYMPLDLGIVNGYQVRLQMYTVPGQVMYERTRLAVLRGVDGVVFVADSSPDKMEENMRSVHELEQHLALLHKDISSLPLVMQWNKRDLPDAVPVATLDHYLNRWNSQCLPATALLGDGVLQTLRSISLAVIAHL
jgi:mutual gliding-motility protein MglA